MKLNKSSSTPARAERRHAGRTSESAPRAGSGLAPLFVSVEDAGAALGIGRTKAWQLVRSGQLRSVRIDRRVLVPVRSLESFAAALVAEIA